MLGNCWECYTEFERGKKGAFFCRTCNPKYNHGDIVIEVHSTPGITATKGYSGYNRGLGEVVQNKEHYDHLVKSKGLLNVGDKGHLQSLQSTAKEAKLKRDKEKLSTAYTQAKRAHGL